MKLPNKKNFFIVEKSEILIMIFGKWKIINSLVVLILSKEVYIIRISDTTKIIINSKIYLIKILILIIVIIINIKYLKDLKIKLSKFGILTQEKYN